MMYIPDFAATVISSISYTLDAMIYTGMVGLISYMPETWKHDLYHLLFTVETLGAQEKSECVYLLNFSHPVNNHIMFKSVEDKLITNSIESAIALSQEKGIPIQTVVCHRSSNYFVGSWVFPQPFELVYEYGEVGEAKTEAEYREYFMQKMLSRPSTRLYHPDMEQSRLMLIAFLCSKYSLVLVYLLLRYQWYNRVCFQNLLILAAIAGMLF